MKKTLLTLAIAITVQFSYAQWTSSAGNIYPLILTDKVGIGTLSPTSGLHLYDPSNHSINTVETGTNAGAFTKYKNTTGELWIGKDRSVGGAIMTGSLPSAGVVTTTTAYPLQLGTNDAARVTILSDGNVGIGTTNPSVKLDVQAASYAANFQNNSASNEPVVSISQLNAGGNDAAQGLYIDARSTGSALDIVNNATPLLRVKTNGNVLIGQTTQANSAYKLDVAGYARANKIVVNTSGADFVFERKYKLPQLSDIKSYIDENHHLPEIASAAEMQKNGMDVGELNTKLLQKVEELTLYIIQQNERINKLEEALKTDKAK